MWSMSSTVAKQIAWFISRQALISLRSSFINVLRGLFHIQLFKTSQFFISKGKFHTHTSEFFSVFCVEENNASAMEVTCFLRSFLITSKLFSCSSADCRYITILLFCTNSGWINTFIKLKTIETKAIILALELVTLFCSIKTLHKIEKAQNLGSWHAQQGPQKILVFSMYHLNFAAEYTMLSFYIFFAIINMSNDGNLKNIISL